MSRYLMQRDFAWPRHSMQHVFNNPTWPTEWRQVTPLLAQIDYMFSNSSQLSEANYALLGQNTQIGCLNKTLGLIDYRNCAHMPGTKDIVDWPPTYRDDYVFTDINTVLSAYAAKAGDAMSLLASITSHSSDVALWANQASLLRRSMSALLVNSSTNLFRDGLDVEHYSFHATMFSLWADVVSEQQKPAVLQFLKQKRMTGSVYAAFMFVPSLYKIEEDQGNFGLEMLTACDKNSWCMMLHQNATATMESWFAYMYFMYKCDVV